MGDAAPAELAQRFRIDGGAWPQPDPSHQLLAVSIIGHADQIGSDAQNFKISAERAAAVVDYLVSKGVNPQRLASRAVGDTDLLTLNDDAASLALNRRTEIIFSGLLSN